MPAINSLKKYVQGGIYHVYNRGNRKSEIFLAAQDYDIFCYLLERYLLPCPVSMRCKSYSNQIKVHAFCLMPNHFHLLLEQIQERAISSFMHGLCLSYSMIFNKRYEKVGRLFQGVYKARLITRESEISTVASYIHINPSEVGATPEDYPYSSYGCYLGKDTCRFLTTELL